MDHPRWTSLAGFRGNARLAIPPQSRGYMLLALQARIVTSAVVAERRMQLAFRVESQDVFHFASNGNYLTNNASAILHWNTAFAGCLDAIDALSIGSEGVFFIRANPLPPNGLAVQPSDVLNLWVDGGDAGDVVSDIWLLTTHDES